MVPPNPAQGGERLTILALNKRSWRDENPGGAELNLEHTLKEVSKAGHTVILLTGPEADQPKEEWDDGVKIRRLPIGTRISGVTRIIISYLTVTVYFHYFVTRIDPDVVYTVNTPLPWLLLTTRPTVGIFHHLANTTFFETHPLPLALLGIFFQHVAVFWYRSNHTVSVSPSTSDALLSRGHPEDTVHEIKNGVDIARYSVGERADHPRILYVGGLYRNKGADRLPAIHRHVQTEYDGPVQLDVAGRDGPVSDTIRNYCEGNATATFHGYVTEEEKIRLMQRSWAFLAPSRVEGWGMAVLEANACGTPAVGMDVRGLKDSICHRETGLLTPDGDIEAFAEGVTELLTDETVRQELGANAREWAEQHTWERAGKQLETVFITVGTDSERW